MSRINAAIALKIAPVRAFLAIVLLVFSAAALPAPRRSPCRGRARRPGSSRTHSGRPPAPISIRPPSPAEPSDCRKRLEVIAVIEPMPRLIGPGACGGARHGAARCGAVCRSCRASRSSPAAVLRCEMAESLRRLDPRRSGAAARQSTGTDPAQRRELRRFRMPRPQPGDSAPDERARQGQCLRSCAHLRSPTAASSA